MLILTQDKNNVKLLGIYKDEQRAKEALRQIYNRYDKCQKDR